jgi:hypothetical protein
VVLKAEMTSGKIGSGQSIDFIAQLHKKLTEDMEVVMLDKPTLDEILQVPATDFDFQPAAIGRKYLHDLIAAGNFFVWYTMKFFESFKKLDDTIEKNKDHQDMQKVGAYKLARKMCTDPNLLPNLGKVIAVDMFCGNTDRFQPDGTISNEGNVGFQKNPDKTYAPVGVDFFYADVEVSRMHSKVGSLNQWSGRVLLNQQSIDQFAADAVRALNALFASKLTPRAMPQDGILGQLQIQALAHGISEGVAVLKRHLNRRLKERGLPSGVTQRMELLGWLVQNQLFINTPTVGRGNFQLGQNRLNPPPVQNPPPVVLNPPPVVQNPPQQTGWLRVQPKDRV